MASASTTTNYPQRLYKKGKTPNQQKSMSYYSYLSNFQNGGSRSRKRRMGCTEEVISWNMVVN
ncbi:BnaC06g10800D [Brassica napus]|uniref:BnaC06g10800D protein n=1 Tax=Brassica napus TaxID=3708 RepID=A0A078GLB8_BRANA|nr:BnaC06g10800D [Brassica napus]